MPLTSTSVVFCANANGSSYGTAPATIADVQAAMSPTSSYRTLVTLGADVASTAATTYQDVTGLSFAVVSGTVYRFYAIIFYTCSAATIGARFAADAPASPTLFAYNSRQPQSATADVMINANANDLGGVPSASPFTSGNIAEISGIIKPSANGTLMIRFAPETATASGIVVKAGSTLERW